MASLGDKVSAEAREAIRAAAGAQVGLLLSEGPGWVAPLGGKAAAEAWEAAEAERHHGLATRRDLLQYKARVAEVKAALRRLPGLAQDLASGALDPEDMAQLTGDDLASEEARQHRAQERAAYFARHVVVKKDVASERHALNYYRMIGGTTSSNDVEAEVEHSDDEEAVADDELDAMMKGLTVKDDAAWARGERVAPGTPGRAAAAEAEAEPQEENPLAKLFAALPSASAFGAPAAVAPFEVRADAEPRALFPTLATPGSGAAAEPVTSMSPDKTAGTVAELKAQLKARGLATTGRKQELLERLAADADKENPQACLVALDGSVLRVEKQVKLPCSRLGFKDGRLVLAAVGAGVAVNGQPLSKGSERQVSQTDVVQCGLVAGKPTSAYKEFEVLVEDAHRVHELMPAA